MMTSLSVARRVLSIFDDFYAPLTVLSTVGILTARKHIHTVA